MCPASDEPTPQNGGVNLRRLGRATAVAAAALAGTSAAPAAARASEPVALTGRIGGLGDLAVNPDGTIRIGTVDFQSHNEISAIVTSFDAQLGSQTPYTVLAPSKQQTFAETSLTPTGTVVSYNTMRKPHPRVRVFDVSADGKRGPAQTVSDKAHAARLIGDTQAAGGAVAVTFDQHLGDGRWEPRVAYRPAGATSFLPSIAIGAATRGAFVYHPVVLAPDGTGAVLSNAGGGQDFSVRRLLADGTLGPTITLAPRSRDGGSMKVAFGPTGTMAIGIGTRTYLPTATGADPAEVEDLYATSVPAGSNTPTPLQHLGQSKNPFNDYPTFVVAVGADDHTVLATGLNAPDRTLIYEGAPSALAQTASITGFGVFSEEGQLFIADDGSVTAAWAAPIGKGSASTIVATHRAAGATAYSAPRSVIHTADKNPFLEAMRPVPGGDAVLVYAADDGSTTDDIFDYAERFTP